MGELTLIAVVFAMAIEYNCKDLFDDKPLSRKHIAELQRNNHISDGRVVVHNLGGSKDLPILCGREHPSEATKEADAANS